jgi:hypothetical protein
MSYRDSTKRGLSPHDVPTLSLYPQLVHAISLASFRPKSLEALFIGYVSGIQKYRPTAPASYEHEIQPPAVHPSLVSATGERNRRLTSYLCTCEGRRYFVHIEMDQWALDLCRHYTEYLG